MRITAYLVFNVLARSAAALILFVSVYSAVDLVEVSSSLGQNGDFPGFHGRLDVLREYPFRLPMIAAHVLPLSLMIGVLTSLSSLRTRGEWNAMRSAGLAPVGLAACLLAVPLAGTFFSWALLFEISPRALEKWELALGSQKKQPTGRWCKTRTLLFREEDDNGFSLAVERNPRGFPIAYSALSASRADTWVSDRGWQIGAAQRVESGCGSSGGGMTASLSGMQGASLSSKKLNAAISQSKKKGWSTAPLEAEWALRTALAAACLIVPLFGLGLCLRGEESRATRLIAKGAAAASIFWVILAAAWNGAVSGMWSPAWVSLAVPLVFFSVGFALIAVNGRR